MKAKSVQLQNQNHSKLSIDWLNLFIKPQYSHFSSISGTFKGNFRCRFVSSTTEYTTRLFNTCSMCCFIGFNRHTYLLNAAVAFAVPCTTLALLTNSRNYLFDKASGCSLFAQSWNLQDFRMNILNCVSAFACAILNIRIIKFGDRNNF